MGSAFWGAYTSGGQAEQAVNRRGRECVEKVQQQWAVMESPVARAQGCSAGKESACGAGGPSSIPGSGRSSGEGRGYPLQCAWASVVAQLVKIPLAMRETWV